MQEPILQPESKRMKTESILGGPLFIILGFVLSRLLPPSVGYWIARRVARWISRRRTEMFCNARANISRVVGPDVSAAELDRMAGEAVYYTIRSNYDMMHTTKADYRKGRAPVRIDPDEWQRTWQALREGRGTILVGPHMSNFDLAMQWIAGQGVRFKALSLANPNLGTQTVNRVRMHQGIEIMPINVQSLRKAIEHLKRGGVVVTGVDRPTSPEDEMFEFFGEPAPMPDGPVRLALQTNSRIIVAGCIQEPDGVYRVHMAPPLEMERTGSRSKDIRHNEQRLLAIVEGMIRLAPEQWLMFVPVWPREAQPCRA